MSSSGDRDPYSDPHSTDFEERALEREQLRRNNNTFQAAFLGILIALLAGVGAFFLFNQRDPEPTPAASPTVNPSTTPASSPPTQETTIIREQTREVTPVPQATQPPDVNITVPAPEPPAEQTNPTTNPAPASQQPASSPANSEVPSSSNPSPEP